KDLKDNGATTVALGEDTLESLSKEGRASLFTKQDVDNARRHDAEAFTEALSFLPPHAMDAPQTFALFSDADLAARVQAEMASKMVGSSAIPILYKHPLKNEAIVAVPA